VKLRVSLARVGELVRFYQAAAINAVFGFGTYALFVALGMNMYVAQVVAHVLGATFNYFTYSRYAFRSSESQKMRYVVVYAINYVISLGLLALTAVFIKSPYGAALISLVLTSVINYVVLRRFVFFKSAAA
jgi:putative flippase GtrA